MERNNRYIIKKKNVTQLTKECLRSILHFSFFIFHFSFLISCIYDEIDSSQSGGGDEKEVTISIAVPHQQARTTSRALTPADEDHISTIELLVYDASGNFDYLSNGQDITDEGSTNLKSFQVVLRTGTADITLLANCRDILQELYPGGIPVGIAKAALEEKIKLSITGKWEANPLASGYRDIPMWGEIGQVSITDNTDKLKNGEYIELYRMLATIDVTTSLTDPSVFSLTSVRVYNTQAEGAVIPADKNTFGTVPTLPAGSQTVKGPFLYDGTAIVPDAAGQNACTGEIYLFEAEKGQGKTSHPDHPCIVVGGKYKGEEKFYRIDFQSGQNYLHLLRNHRYQIIITSVDDQGFNTPDEAYESFPVGIQATVIDWSAEQNQEVNVGGKYILTVSTDELVFNPEAGTQVLYVYTDHPGGWKFVEDNFSPAVDWITFSVVKGNPNVYTEVKVTVTAQAAYDDPTRVYEIPVIVDNVEKNIRFAQLGHSEASLEIFANPQKVILRKNMTQPVEIQVSTYPFDMPLYFSYSGDPIQWETSGFPTNGQTSHTVKLHPKTIQTDDQLSGILTIYIQDDYGHIASCQVEISWIDRITGFQATTQNPYPYTPGTHSFTVISTVPWLVNNVSQPSEWIAGFTGQQNASPSPGVTYPFTLAGNPTFADRQMEVEVTQPETSETTTVSFIQQATPMVLSAPDGTQEMTVIFPAEGGQKVVIQFLTNLPWIVTGSLSGSLFDVAGTSSVYSDYKSVYTDGVEYPVTQPVWTPETVTLEYETKDYLWAATTPRAGRAFTGATRQFRNTANNKVLKINFTRIPPHMARLSTATVGTLTRTSYPATSNAHIYGLTMLADEAGWTHWFPAGETVIYTLRLGTNTSCTVWSSFDTNTKFTYPHGASSAFSNSAAATTELIIPENKTGSNRNFTLYIQKEDGVIVQIPCIQHGENPTFTYTVECESGTISLDSYLSTHNNTFPTGGLVLNVTATGFQQGVYIMGLMDNTLEEYGAIKRARAITTNGTTTKYTVRPNPGETGQNRTYGLTYASLHSSVNRIGSDAAKEKESNHPRSPYKEFRQDHKNYTLSTKRIVARESLYNKTSTNLTSTYYTLYTATWETAAGIDGYASTTLTNLTGYTPQSDFNNPASCASYSEWDDGGKTWRLPTATELTEMYNRRYEIGGFYNDSDAAAGGSFYYWAIDNTGNYAKVVNFGTSGSGTTVDNSKVYGTARVRCVRDQ